MFISKMKRNTSINISTYTMTKRFIKNSTITSSSSTSSTATTCNTNQTTTATGDTNRGKREETVKNKNQKWWLSLKEHNNNR